MRKRLLALLLSVTMTFTLVQPGQLAYATENTGGNGEATENDDDGDDGVSWIQDTKAVTVSIDDDTKTVTKEESKPEGEYAEANDESDENNAYDKKDDKDESEDGFDQYEEDVNPGSEIWESDSDTKEGLVSLSTYYDERAEVDYEKWSYIPITIENVIKNTSDETINDLKVYIIVLGDYELSIIDDYGDTQTITKLDPGEEATVTWHVQAYPIAVDQWSDFAVRVEQDEELIAEAGGYIVFPALLPNIPTPEIIGEATVEGYTGSSVTIKLPYVYSSVGIEKYKISYNGINKYVNLSDSENSTTDTVIGGTSGTDWEVSDSSGDSSGDSDNSSETSGGNSDYYDGNEKSYITYNSEYDTDTDASYILTTLYGLTLDEETSVEIRAIDYNGTISEPVYITVVAKAPNITSPTDLTETTVVGNKIYLISGKAEVGSYSEYTISWHKNGTNEWVELETFIRNISSDTLPYTYEFSSHWDISGLETGEYEVKFTVTDADGISTEVIAPYIVNNDVPSPIDGLNAQSDLHNIDLSWAIATEYYVTGYRVYRREANTDSDEWQLLKTITGDRNKTNYTDTTAVKDVEYEYTVTAISQYGLESEYCDAVTATLLYDTERPVVNSLTPSNNTVLTGTKTISAKATDNEAVVKMELYYRLSKDTDGILIASSEEGEVSGLLDTTAIEDGKIYVYALAWDEAGNVSNGTPTYTYTLDNTGPSQVTDLSYTSSATVITLSWSYVQDNDFDHFVVEELDEKTGDYHTVKNVSDTLGVNITNLRPSTTHTYRVYAVDTRGNKGTVSDTIKASTQYDITVPVVTAISPSAGYKNKDIIVKFSLQDDDTLEHVDIQVSRDRINWNTVESKTFEEYYSKQEVEYKVKISDYEEDGSLYIRAIPYDLAGNKGNSNNDTAPYVEYILDRVPPSVPANVTAYQSSVRICVKWDNDQSGETQSYRVLRSESENGTYEEIASSVKAINYYDSTAEADKTYWYKVQAVDTVGNISEASLPVSCLWTNIIDNQAPEILSVSPADGSTLGGSNTSISVLAEDDFILDRVVITYKKNTNILRALVEEEKTATINGNGEYYVQNSAKLDLSDFSTGDSIHVSVVAYDTNNNKSDVKEFDYTIDTTAPSISNLAAVIEDDSNVKITWNAGDNSDDLNGYYIYRTKNGTNWTKVGSRAKRDDGDYSISDALTADGSYTYKVVAVDIVGNQSETLSEEVSYTKPITPVEDRIVADFTTDLQQQVGVQYLFDATQSYADAGIDTYLFDFGDGTTSDKVQFIHVYDEIGEYTVTLTVTDNNGKKSTSKQTIEVKERETLGTLTVTVVDDSGKPVSDTPVYFDMDSDAQIIKYTDVKGVVTFTKNAGSYKVGAYKDEYLPVTKQVTISGGTSKSIELVMVNQPIVTGQFEVNRMTLDEIKAAGIDYTEAANQNCVQTTIKLTYGEQKVELNYTYNNNGKIIDGNNKAIVDDGNEEKWVIAIPIPIPIEIKDDGITGTVGSVSSKSSSDIVAIIELPVSASALKEFFNVKLYILNQATKEFTLVDNELTLNVPDGLTVMPQSQNSLANRKSSIGGQETWELSWILRGDEKGEYNLSADYSSLLKEFDANVSATFETDEPIKVYGMDAIKLIADINSNIAYGGLYFDLSLENTGGADLYLPSIDLMEEAIRIYEKNRISNGKEEGQDYTVRVLNTYLTNSSGYTQYLGENGSVDTLAAGERFTKQYAIYNAVTTTDLTYLREAVAEAAEEAGVQIEINIFTKDLYNVDNAYEKYNSIFDNQTKKDMYNYIMKGGNFRYYQQALKDDNWLSDYLYNEYVESKAIINLDLFDFIDYCRGRDGSETDIARQYIYEMLSDESYQKAVDMTIDDKYLKITKNILTVVKNTLGKGEYFENLDEYDKVAMILESDDNVRQMASTLENDGLETFYVRLLNVIGGYLSAAALSNVKDYLYSSLGETFMDAVGKNIDTGFDNAILAIKSMEVTFEAWNTASEINSKLIQISAAEEQAIALTGYILDYKEKGFTDTPTYKEVKEIHEGLINGFKSQQQEFAEQLIRGIGNEILLEDLVIPCIEAVFLDGMPCISVVFKTLQVLYNTADYLLGWEDTANVYIGLKVGLYISRALEKSTDRLSDGSDSIGFLTSLKYLIKVRLVGERMFVNFVNEYNGFSFGYREEFVIPAINKEDGINVNSLDEYYLLYKEKILSYRDTLYGEIATNEGQPSAPEVSISFYKEQTEESFNSDYEYSFNNVDWITCGDADDNEIVTAIDITPKTTAQTLYVRVKETSQSRVGVTAVIAIPAMPSHLYATAANKSKNTYEIQGLTANHAYEVLLSDSDDATDADWSNATSATADADGELKVTLNGSGGYLLYRYPATYSSFASAVHSIAISGEIDVEISAVAEGNGNILSDGEKFESKTLEAGETLNLSVEYDTVSTSFDGWYIDGVLYSKDENLSIEATSNMALTAKFTELPQYTLTVKAGEGGRVDGGETVYKWQKATANAYADKGYTFNGWYDTKGELVSVNAARSVTMTDDVTLTAKFEKLPTARIFVSLSLLESTGRPVYQPDVTVEVAGNTYEVTKSKSLNETSGAIGQGEQMILTANSTASATFENWQDHNGKIVSTNNVFTTTTEEYNNFIAVYSRRDVCSVTYVNKSGTIRSQKEYANISMPITQGYILNDIPDGIYMDGYTFEGWKMVGTNIVYHIDTEEQKQALQAAIIGKLSSDKDVTLTASYQQEQRTYDVKVTNGTGSGKYTSSTAITIKANEPESGKYFVGWYDGETLLTTNMSYSFYVTDNRTLEAKYEDKAVDEVGTTRIESVTPNKSTKKISFVSMSSVPSSCTIQKAGVIATSESTIGTSEEKFTASTAKYVRYGSPTAKNFKYTWTKGSVTERETWYVRAYLVYKDSNGNSHTVYGDIVAATLDGKVNNLN